MNDIEQHDAAWNDRLQDLLEGEAVGMERAATEAHLATCARCRMQYAQLKRVDARLASKFAVERLDSSFDRQLFARIDALDALTREQARQRADRELEQNLQALARRWRRGLAYLVGGAVAGIALAFAFLGWADSAEVANRLIVAAGTAGLTHAASLQVVVTALIGAMVGGAVSTWLAQSIE